MCFSIEMSKGANYLENRLDDTCLKEGFEDKEKIFSLQEILAPDEFHALLGPSHVRSSTKLFKSAGDDGKIFPNYFANVIISRHHKRLITPMRYRIRPHGPEEEIPTKFNVFNARFDSLESARTWRGLFMRRHGLVVFESFYEWVEKAGKKQLINFSPKDQEVMWAPCLWDDRTSPHGEIHFQSFALLTDDPPREIQIMGHDRCPIFLKEEYIDEWLNPEKTSVDEIYGILKEREKVHYQYHWAY